MNAAKRTGEGCCGLRGTGGARVGGCARREGRGGRARRRARRRDSHAKQRPGAWVGASDLCGFLLQCGCRMPGVSLQYVFCIAVRGEGCSGDLFRKFVEKVPEGGLVYDLTVHESAVCYDERCWDGRDVIQAYVW